MTRPGVGSNTSNTAASVVPHSAWRSPVAYLFGGLAAMLGLVAFALLILACSYWKLSDYLGTGGADADGEESSGDAAKPPPPSLCDKSVVVVMAGDCKPTFLATPVASHAAADGRKMESAVNSPERDAIPIQRELDRNREESGNS
ncbi:glutamine dumper [Musa troglodytarum]|uniref:Glutamine dumper n=2 Tax=Musa troglodytarum TaxID=320322 RepID=A0A9E7L6S6_9LILI|nr:glutamine dumper [Musa troglodytarum]